MNTEETKPTATRVGTLELALELKDLPAVLAGLEQIKVAAQEAAAAVASIGDSATAPLVEEIRKLRLEIGRISSAKRCEIS